MAGFKKCLTTCMPGLAPDSEALLNGGTPNSNAPVKKPQIFTASFILPYKREDVFAELTSANQPLGLSSQNVKIITIERAGKQPSMPVSAGCVRKTEFGKPFGGYTVSELVDVTPQQSLRWRQLESKTLFNLMGAEVAGEVRAPECLIELETVASGTKVMLTYTFDRVKANSMVLSVLNPCLPKLLKGFLERKAPQTWASEMRQKGHVAVAPFANGSEVKATRSQQQKLKDQEEEARIKNLAKK